MVAFMEYVRGRVDENDERGRTEWKYYEREGIQILAH